MSIIIYHHFINCLIACHEALQLKFITIIFDIYQEGVLLIRFLHVKAVSSEKINLLLNYILNIQIGKALKKYCIMKGFQLVEDLT